MDCIWTVQEVWLTSLYIICPAACLSVIPAKTPWDFVCHPLPPSLVHAPRMPFGNRKSRSAKRKREEGRAQGYATFAKHAPRSPSPHASDYCPSTSDNEDESASGFDSSNERGSANEAAAHVAALQRLYSIFLPPHLQLNEEIREKRRKTKHTRVVIYTGKSRTTRWRKGVDQRKSAKGSAKLDKFGFVLRSVSPLSQKVLKQSISLSTEKTAQPATT